MISSLDDMAPPGYKIYNASGTVPEFRLFTKKDGSIEQHVRYVNKTTGYTGKWIVISHIKEAEGGSDNIA